MEKNRKHDIIKLALKNIQNIQYEFKILQNLAVG